MRQQVQLYIFAIGDVIHNRSWIGHVCAQICAQVNERWNHWKLEMCFSMSASAIVGEVVDLKVNTPEKTR